MKGVVARVLLHIDRMEVRGVGHCKHKVHHRGLSTRRPSGISLLFKHSRAISKCITDWSIELRYYGFEEGTGVVVHREKLVAAEFGG